MQLTDRQTLADLLRRHGLRPDKALGQNFLINPKVLQVITAAAQLTAQDLVVEIGAGLGVLTQELAAQAQKVIALEYDQKIFPVLQKNLAEYANVELQNLDVRRFVPPSAPYKLVANIPYYLTSPILRQFLVETVDRPSVLVLLIQREVAEKICDTKRLSVLSLQVRVFGEPELVCRVAADNFLPPPKVESAVLKICLHSAPIVSTTDLTDFFHLVHAGFAAPRKKLAASLALGLRSNKTKILELLQQSEIDPELRAERLSIADWQRLLMAQRSA